MVYPRHLGHLGINEYVWQWFKTIIFENLVDTSLPNKFLLQVAFSLSSGEDMDLVWENRRFFLSKQ